MAGNGRTGSPRLGDWISCGFEGTQQAMLSGEQRRYSIAQTAPKPWVVGLRKLGVVAEPELGEQE